MKSSSAEQPTPRLKRAQKFTPRKYQRRAIKFLIERGAAGLFLDPGLGKTMSVYAAYELIRDRAKVGPMLVITLLKPAYEVWPAEVDKWGLKLNVVVLHGKNREENLNSDADVYVINYEGLDWLVDQFAVSNKLRSKFKGGMLVIDESSAVKNRRTNRFENIKAIMNLFKRRVILTGTPSPNGLMDLWSQIYILDGGASLGRWITHFRSKYFHKSGYMGYDWQLNEGADTDIYKAIGPLILRIGDDELEGMPKIITTDYYVEMPDKAWGIYTDMRADLVASFGRHKLTAKNAAVATMKCRQIASGGLYVDMGRSETGRQIKRKVLNLHDAKTEKLAELIEELNGKPVLVAVEFQHDVERIRKVLGNKIPSLDGSIDLKEARRLMRLWNEGKIPVLLANPQSTAHGLNLQESGSHVIWYTMTWNLEWYIQFIRRLARQGQKAKRVMNYRILCRGTVDEVVAATTARKDATQKDLLNGLKSYLRRSA